MTSNHEDAAKKERALNWAKYRIEQSKDNLAHAKVSDTSAMVIMFENMVEHYQTYVDALTADLAAPEQSAGEVAEAALLDMIAREHWKRSCPQDDQPWERKSNKQKNQHVSPSTWWLGVFKDLGLINTAVEPTADDVAEAVKTANDMIICATSWVPETCLMGNVRAGDIAKSLRTLIKAALSSPPAVDKSVVEKIKILRNHASGIYKIQLCDEILALLGGNTGEK